MSSTASSASAEFLYTWHSLQLRMLLGNFFFVLCFKRFDSLLCSLLFLFFGFFPLPFCVRLGSFHFEYERISMIICRTLNAVGYNFNFGLSLVIEKIVRYIIVFTTFSAVNFYFSPCRFCFPCCLNAIVAVFGIEGFSSFSHLLWSPLGANRRMRNVDLPFCFKQSQSKLQ